MLVKFALSISGLLIEYGWEMATMVNGFNLMAEDLLTGQDPKGLVMRFFKHSGRVRIRSIRVDGREYRGGRLAAPLIDPETGCTAKEMGKIRVRRPIRIRLVTLTESEWAQLNQALAEEVA
jgi:hypothetical protein